MTRRGDDDTEQIQRAINESLQAFEGLSGAQAMTALGAVCGCMISAMLARTKLTQDEVIERHTANIKHIIRLGMQ